MLDNQSIAQALREIATLYSLQEGEGYKARAYERGAIAVEELNEDIARLIAEERLTDVENIGSGLARQIAELWRTGSSELLERLRSEVPEGTVELSRVPGLTLRRIRALHAALGIRNVEELRAALEQGRVRTVKGFGPKLETQLLEALERDEPPADSRVLLLHALELSQRVQTELAALPGIRAVHVAGETRRYVEAVTALEFVLEVSDGAAATAALERLGARPLPTGTSFSWRLTGVPIRLHLALADALGAAWLLATGPEGHLDWLREHAARAGLTLTSEGLRPDQAAAPLTSPHEAHVYERLGLPFVPPELREATVSGVPTIHDDLLTLADLRGAVHCHTVYSDGKATIEEMARAALAQGHSYITITDHSPTAHYAGGLTLDRLKEQWDEIARVQELVPIRIFRGTESDILADGSLDYPDDVLARFDVVIASIHARHKMDSAAMTERLIRAMRHPVYKIWGHALGRLVLSRAPIACDVPRVLDAIAESRAAIEINSDPHRLDLAPEWLREARQRGIPLIVSSDAHSTAGLGVLHFGVGLARRAGVRRAEVLNTLTAAEFAARVRPS